MTGRSQVLLSSQDPPAGECEPDGIARRLNVTTGLVSQWERGERRPRGASSGFIGTALCVIVPMRGKPMQDSDCAYSRPSPSRGSPAARESGTARFARRAAEGLADADLGGGVIKQRIARPGRGKSGGVRAILLLRRGELAFFVHGFAKSDRENLRRDELRALRALADEMLGLDGPGLKAMLKNGTIGEVDCDG